MNIHTNTATQQHSRESFCFVVVLPWQNLFLLFLVEKPAAFFLFVDNFFFFYHGIVYWNNLRWLSYELKRKRKRTASSVCEPELQQRRERGEPVERESFIRACGSLLHPYEPEPNHHSGVWTTWTASWLLPRTEETSELFITLSFSVQSMNVWKHEIIETRNMHDCM